MNWKDVEGYFSYTNLYDIAFKYCPDNSTFVEVGSWMGKSTCYIGEQIKRSSKNIKFYAVDTWIGSEEPQHKEKIEDLQNENLTLFDTFKYHLKSCGVDDYVTPLRTTSLEAASQFEDNSLDFVHIDASHDYDNVIADIKAWYPKVKPGGFITGDDYVVNWDGVVKAVNEYFSGKSVVLLDRMDGTISKVWLHQKQGEKMEVTLYAICKNEEDNVEKFLKNTEKFSNVVVVDTGSTDNTVQLLKDAGITVYEHPQSKEEFSFSDARNKAMSYVETDWAFSLDFNEDIEEFFPEGLGVIEKEFTCFKHLRFDDKDGEVSQSNESHVRFHRTKNYIWIHAIHEYPTFIPTEDYLNESIVDTTIKITKKINNPLSKELFYLSICEREHEKNPTEWYYVWFIFNHYYNVKNFDKALEYGREFLNVSKPYFDTFRVSVFVRCSQILFTLNQVQQSANYAFHALSEAMNMGDPYLTQAFSHLIELSTKLNNPNITVFATGFSPETAKMSERHTAIDKLFLTNLDDVFSCWKGHRNFADWLVRTVKPKVTVDLGIDWGFSMFSLALPRIGKVYGVDNFTGDAFIGPQDSEMKYHFVMNKVEKLFLQDTIEVIKGDFNEVAETWDKKIDVLHIDGDHAYESVKRDFETWSKFLSDDGIIIMHDTCVEEIDEKEYGVKKFFEELDWPKVNFTHTFGLGVVSKNKELIEFIEKNIPLDRPL